MEETLLLERYEPMIRSIARQFHSRLVTRMEFEDLLQLGRLALIEAARRWDEDSGMPLEMWLRVRIRGKLVDQLHLSTGTTRAGVRQIRRQRLLLEAQESAAQVLNGRDETPRSDRAYVSMMFESLLMVQDLCGPNEEESIADAVGVERGSTRHPGSAEKLLLRQERYVRLMAAIERLSEPSRMIIRMHYLEDRSINEIADHIGTSRPWISRLHMRAVDRLRAILQGEELLDDESFW
jgi:RNA polymerase sigma factor for flagellar operon FliA